MEKKTCSANKSHCKLRPGSPVCQQACLSVKAHNDSTGTPACPACLPPSCCHHTSVALLLMPACTWAANGFSLPICPHFLCKDCWLAHCHPSATHRGMQGRKWLHRDELLESLQDRLFQGWGAAAALLLSVSEEAKIRQQGPAPGSLQSLTKMSGENYTENPPWLQFLVIHFLLSLRLFQKLRICPHIMGKMLRFCKPAKEGWGGRGARWRRKR